MKFNFALLAVFTAFIFGPASAEIYKYKDEHGCWHFTDKPVQGEKVEELETSKPKAKTITKDLATLFLDKYKPATPIERASLAVIAIKTSLVEGSGFFVHENGYILTNKHVVRPTETEAWKELEEKMNKTEKAYRAANKVLRNERDDLNDIEDKLKKYRYEIDRMSDTTQKAIAEEEYKMFQGRLQRYKKNLKIAKKNYDASKREYEKARRDFTLMSSASILSKDFKIILKDETELFARLISISEKEDLALLKIDNHKTPYIECSDQESLRHGMKVYVIGNPLGMKDVITSGVVAGLKDNYVITDAKMLPGSSGGPLLSEDGKVIGVSSKRVSQVIGGEGFGVAISINTALSEFNQYIQ